MTIAPIIKIEKNGLQDIDFVQPHRDNYKDVTTTHFYLQTSFLIRIKRSINI